LWARLEISRGGHEGAATIAIRTGLGMARHVGQGPTILQGLVGSAIGGIMCRELELYLQGKDSPNLYRALANLPRPFVDIEKAIKNEMKVSLDSGTRRISKRLDNNLNGLQCVEAIRHYAAAHNGRLPQTLADIKDMEIPVDLMSDKAFEYQRTAKCATLCSAIPEGGSERDVINYEIVLKK